MEKKVAPDETLAKPLSHGYIAQWLERLTADQQVPGSNPGVPYEKLYVVAVSSCKVNVLACRQRPRGAW